MSKIIYPEQSNYLEQNCISSDPLLVKMEQFAEANKIPILNKSSAILLEQLVQIHEAKNFLEIGTAIAYSTIRVARILRNSSKITTIDFSRDNINLAKKYIHEAKLDDQIKIIEGDALNILPNINEEFDFIFLDADKEDYLDLFRSALNILKVGGVLLVDNLLWHGYVASTEVPESYKKSTEFIRKFNAKFLSHPQLKSTIIPQGDGLGLGIKIS